MGSEYAPQAGRAEPAPGAVEKENLSQEGRKSRKEGRLGRTETVGAVRQTSGP